MLIPARGHAVDDLLDCQQAELLNNGVPRKILAQAARTKLATSAGLNWLILEPLGFRLSWELLFVRAWATTSAAALLQLPQPVLTPSSC